MHLKGFETFPSPNSTRVKTLAFWSKIPNLRTFIQHKPNKKDKYKAINSLRISRRRDLDTIVFKISVHCLFPKLL